MPRRRQGLGAGLGRAVRNKSEKTRRRTSGSGERHFHLGPGARSNELQLVFVIKCRSVFSGRRSRRPEM